MIKGLQNHRKLGLVGSPSDISQTELCKTYFRIKKKKDLLRPQVSKRLDVNNHYFMTFSDVLLFMV